MIVLFANVERDLCPFPSVILAHCEDAVPAIGDRDAYRRWEIQDRRILDKEECLTYVFGLELVPLSNMPINHSVRKSLL